MIGQGLPQGRPFRFRRVVVTGPNGAGKTSLARALARRTGLPLHHADAAKLTTGWQRRPHDDARALIEAAVAGDDWIVEGGPGLLRAAIDRADLVIRLDPPLVLRAWRLALRPWKGLGRTRPELPAGNPDRLLRQYRFAIASLRADRAFRESLDDALQTTPHVLHLRRRAEVARLLGP